MSETRSFKDGGGREWPIRITVNTIKRVKDAPDLQFDLLNIADQSAIARLIDDPALLVDVLCEVLRPLIESRSMTDADFGEMFYGDILSHAVDALMKAIADFFPSARQRENLLKVWGATVKGMEMAQEMASKTIETELTEDKIKAHCQKAIDEALAR